MLANLTPCNPDREAWTDRRAVSDRQTGRRREFRRQIDRLMDLNTDGQIQGK